MAPNPSQGQTRHGTPRLLAVVLVATLATNSAVRPPPPSLATPVPTLLRQELGRDHAWVKSLSAHAAASTGDLEALMAIAAADPDALQHRDHNGWNPLHEAARGGHLDVVEYLLDEAGLGANERTHRGSGGTPLWWAKKSHGKTHGKTHGSLVRWPTC